MDKLKNVLYKAATIPILSDKVADLVLSRFRDEVSLLRGLKEDIERLKRQARRIRNLLTDAEENRQIEDESVMHWLRELKGVAFDADELIDRYQTHLLVSKQTNGDPSRKRKRSWLEFDVKLLKRRKIATQIADLDQRLKEIADSRQNFRWRSEDGRRSESSQRQRLSRSAACNQGTRIVGRAEEKKEIVQRLTCDLGIVAPALPIYGVAGIGKTTLARLVYHDTQVMGYFDLMIWVCLSGCSDVSIATKLIIEAITSKRCDHLSLDILQSRLAEHLCKNKFLLVLDDFWLENYQFWEVLWVPLLAGKIESKVLITTRNESILRRMTHLLPPFRLMGLEESDCWLLLQDRAFQEGKCDEHENLVEIGKRIVQKFEGSPMAAKSIGGLLYDCEEEEEWANILNEIIVLEQAKNDILPSLQISYHHLPFDLKQCFAYCSIFPSGYEFNKDEVVRLWMAEGLIQLNGRSRLEATGSRHFDYLLLESFIERSGYQKQEKFRMPRLMYDLARFTSEHVLLSGNQVTSNVEPAQARYATLFCQNNEKLAFEKIYQYENLRTLKICGEFCLRLKQVPKELFCKLRCLRVLDLNHSEIVVLPGSVGDLIHLRYLGLSNTRIRRLPESVSDLFNLQTLDLNHSEIEELPVSVGDLTHLRYLGLSNTRIKRLPESVSDLCNLQTLMLSECYELVELPEKLSNLVNLRHLDLHLDWERVTDLTSMPHGINKLTSLRTLSRFIVNSDSNCNLHELKDLNLKGELCILKLENVVDVENVKESRLNGKQYINNLMLRWSDGTCTNDSEGIMEWLRPPKKLKYLRIDNYPGRRFPAWIEDQSFSDLDTVRLSYCKNCGLPLLGKLPQLKNLHVEGMHEVRSIELVGFQSLETLILCDMPNLTRCVDTEEGEIHKLHALSILRCPMLCELSHLPTTLAKLEIKSCQSLSSLPWLPRLRDLFVEEGNENIIRWIGCLTSLCMLTLTRFADTRHITRSSLRPLASLKRLKINEFRELLSLAGNESLQDLASLESLEISSCPELISFSELGLPSKLKYLRMHSCVRLKNLPSCLKHLGSVEHLEIHDVPNLSSRMEEILPNNLLHFSVSGCRTIENWCTQEGAPRIRQIRYASIGSKSQLVNVM
ncbi:putative disease resistance protein RGA3 [Typha angustifolia]|uniref:putative disease resistance protein RGA3 n=1 Tax=Typha angustifolia TaxID=59011 RepID=UPI003C2C59AC